MAKNVVGIDIGGTMVKGALFSNQGSLIKKAAIETPVSHGKNKVMQDLSALLDSLQENEDKAAAVGIGIAGVLDPQREILLESPNLPGWENFALKKILSQAWKIPVCLENDANIAALGEKWVGAGKELDNFLFFTLGTGIGSGLILHGELWTGELGKAGEFGHMTVNPDGVLCACGKQGCLEAYSSGEALTRMAKQALQAGEGSSLSNLCSGNLDALDAKMIYTAASQGDTLSLAIFRKAAHFLAVGIADVNNLLDINTFIVGGGVSKAFDIFKPFLVEEVAKRVFKIAKDKIMIVPSKLGNDAGVFGAGYLAQKGVT